MKTTKEFNFEMFKNGVPAQTKLGNPVRFITMTRDGKMLICVHHRYNVVGNFEKFVAPALEGRNERYHINGKKYNGTETMYDLEMVTPYVVTPKRDARGRFVKSN